MGAVERDGGSSSRPTNQLHFERQFALSSGNNEFLSFTCPGCQKRLKAPPAMAGKRIGCPKCATAIKVPGPVAPKSNEDDWLSLDEPAPPPKQKASDSEKNAPRNTQPSAQRTVAEPTDPAITTTVAVQKESKLPPSSGQSVFDDDLPDLVPLQPSAELSKKDRPVAESPKLQPVKPPKPSPTNPSADDLVFPDIDLPEISLEPEDDSAKRRPTLSPTLDLDDIELEALSPSGPPQKSPKPNSANQSNAGKKSVLNGSLEQLSQDQAALAEHLQLPSEEEFSFPCKVCGTLLYARESKVGSNTRCPDCFSEFRCPSIKPMAM
jgi:DNA-directed RNA polymerase subunit RPC12/RpoP